MFLPKDRPSPWPWLCIPHPRLICMERLADAKGAEAKRQPEAVEAAPEAAPEAKDCWGGP